jgi:hypothetical protein
VIVQTKKINQEIKKVVAFHEKKKTFFNINFLFSHILNTHTNKKWKVVNILLLF